MAKHPTTIEKDYARKLKKIAVVIGSIIDHHTHIEKDDSGSIVKVALQAGLMEMLRNYSQTLDPFARNLANEMISRVNRNNYKWWETNAKQFSQVLKQERYKSVNGMIATKLQHDQVTLIKSLPIEAGLRAQKLAIEATTTGRRASEVAEEIARSGEVTASRAQTIARTEIAKANASFTRSRAEYVGADKYIWRTVEDEVVRESHAEMDGHICSFDDPPTLSDGTEGNAGEFVNCRCYAKVILPSVD